MAFADTTCPHCGLLADTVVTVNDGRNVLQYRRCAHHATQLVAALPHLTADATCTMTAL